MAAGAILGGIQLANLLIPIVGNVITMIVHKKDGSTATLVLIQESDSEYDKVVQTGQEWLAQHGIPSTQVQTNPVSVSAEQMASAFASAFSGANPMAAVRTPGTGLPPGINPVAVGLPGK